jgi:hypothetical protein
LRRKSLIQKLLFKWLQYIGGGRIFQNGVMHATWLNLDYRDGGVVDILEVDAYSGVEVCTPIFLGEVSKKNFFWVANHFLKKNQNSNRHITEQSSTQTRVAMWIIFGSGRIVYVVEEPS